MTVNRQSFKFDYVDTDWNEGPNILKAILKSV